MGDTVNGVLKEENEHILCLWFVTCWANGHRRMEEEGCYE